MVGFRWKNSSDAYGRAEY